MAEKKKGAGETVEDILNAIDQDNLNEKVRNPERKVLVDYIKSDEIKDNKVANFEDFRKKIIGYMKLREKQIMGGDKLSDEVAYGRAANLLNQIYKNEGGIESAYKKARKGEIMKILTQLAETMERVEVDSFTTGVMSKVDPLDFDMHVKIAEAYKERFGKFLPKKLKSATPQVLAGQWESLIHGHAAAIEQAKQSLEQYAPAYSTDKTYKKAA